MSISRRDLLRLGTGAAAFLAAGERRASAAGVKPLIGVFPIVQTPYLDDGAVDVATLAREVRFLDRTGVHGIVWPQNASQYALLSYDERIRGAEAIVEAGRGLRPAIVIGVQAPDVKQAVLYARHAATLKPDAIIALPPSRSADLDLDAVKRYYASIAEACDRPLFVQTAGNMTVDFVLQMARDIPTLRFVKDETGDTLMRMTEFHQKKGDLPLSIFSGFHGRTMIDELLRGLGGTMPVAGWVDLYVRVWDAWQAGRRDEALDMFSKLMLFVTQTSTYGVAGYHYVLYLRGVFPDWKARGDVRPLDEYAQRSIRQNLEFVRPHLKA